MVMKKAKILKINKFNAVKIELEREKEELLKILPNVWCISDTHFYHKNIGRFCGRPQNWFDLIINNWNILVNENDVVLHLGDFAFKSFDDVKRVKERLNGKMYLVRGNHDRHSKTWYKKLNINAISPFNIIIKGKKYYFSHKPNKKLPHDWSNIHGHWHQKCPFTYVSENGNINFNLSVEVINYMPIKLNNITEMVEQNG